MTKNGSNGHDDGDRTFHDVVAQEVGQISVLARITDPTEGLTTAGSASS
ncbi:hypothetical protein [Streptomyces candidus]|uniref:Uncharacterized protein n=1 Tax=Streptomyces candidus TaxID=67283 RepID=A0A7X0HKE3_9ACTN|nr:hypothetical protein [Streptomyces candidus]MBB6439113.1 hypothetical protein [Streptomyces candidus]